MVRNMIRAGVSKNVAKQTSCNDTDSVFDRYDITDEQDLALTTERIAGDAQERLGTFSGTIVDFAEKWKANNGS